MKRSFLIAGLSLLTVSVSAQKKKKQQTIPPPKVAPLPKVIQVENSSGMENMPIEVASSPRPESSLLQMKATRTDGQKIYFKTLEEVQNSDLSQVKALSFVSSISDKKMDSKTLQKIINEGIQLEVLEIDNFAIEDFPEIKTPNHNLKKLVLIQNKLKTLPSSISNWAALEEFNSSNPLQELPDSFSKLKNLKKLNLDYTAFSEFPKSIFSLNNISILYISGSHKENAKITVLPDLFQQLPELKELGVKTAAISSLPKSISTLKKLTHANFSDNQFTSFPEELTANPNLVHVPFMKNPLQWEPFLASVKKIKWRGLFFLYETGLTKKQYEKLQQVLPKIDVYYDEMNG